MIKKITQYLLQRRYALSFLFMLLILQSTLAQVQNPEMYARFDEKTRTLTFYIIRTNKVATKVATLRLRIRVHQLGIRKNTI